MVKSSVINIDIYTVHTTNIEYKKNHGKKNESYHKAD